MNIDFENLNYNITTLENQTKIEYSFFNPKSKKKPIVLLYGLVCNNRHFQYQIDYFTQKNHPLLILNYREHFGSKNPGGLHQCTFKNITDDIILLLKFLKIKKPHLIGHSMGVNIALEIAMRDPDIVEKLILISGSPSRPQDYMFNTNMSYYIFPSVKKILNSNKNLGLKFWQSLYKVKIIRKMILDGGFNPNQVSDEFVKYYAKKIGELGFDLFFKLIEEMKNHNLSSRLHLVMNQTLIMGGDSDNIAPIEGQVIFENYLKNSSLYLIKDGSHVPQVDFHETVNEKIDYFIN
jgi:non-heme chloroperoxidase